MNCGGTRAAALFISLCYLLFNISGFPDGGLRRAVGGLGRPGVQGSDPAPVLCDPALR